MAIGDDDEKNVVAIIIVGDKDIVIAAGRWDGEATREIGMDCLTEFE